MKNSNFAELGDGITLYSIDNDDIIEFWLGENSFPGLSELCLNKKVNDRIFFYGETFIVQYIDKRSSRTIPTSDLEAQIHGGKKVAEADSIKIKRRIGIRDFIVRTTTNKCLYSGHVLTPINAMVNVIKNNTLISQSFPGMYCNKCDRYFLYESTYQEIKKEGYICCKIIKRENMEFYNDVSASAFRSWNKYSILSLYGYSVEKRIGLSDKTRQTILAFLLENNILNPNEIVNYLELFIALRKNDKKFLSAISKWRLDITYVLNYKRGNANIQVKRIFT